MPVAFAHPCATPGCPALVTGQARCAVHAQQYERTRPNADMRRLYHTARWRRWRLFVLRTQPLCALCQAVGIIEPSTDVDHIVPHRGSLQLFWDINNVQALCHMHHSEKTARGE